MEERNRESFATGVLIGCLATLLLVLVFMTGWLMARQSHLGKDSTADNAGAEILTDKETLRKLDEVQSIIEQNYLDDVDSSLLSTYLFKGIAVGLNDPYANYYSVEELKSVKESNQGGYFGVGTLLGQDTESGEISVKEVYEDSPAEKGGLKAGDLLLEVDGTSVKEMTLSETVDLVKSKTGTFVLKIYRPEREETLELTLECGAVELDYVDFEMKADEIGYIKLTEFTRSAVSQFEEALKALDEQGMKKLIVDLRDNPGGLLTSVCDILDMVQSEKLIVYTENRKGRKEEYYSKDKRLVDCEIAVLVNGGSASGSEIFAGAIQDWGMGPVIGTRTYGKGIVQNTFTLLDGSAIKFTVEKYFTPAGQDINGNGITPDIVVEKDDAEAEDDPVLDEAILELKLK